MRLLFLLLLSSFVVHGQKIERYYDYFWKETRWGALYYAVLQKGDSGWHRQVYRVPRGTIYSDGYFEDSTEKVAHGLYREFHDNGYPKLEGTYSKGQKHGTWARYHDNGMTADSAHWEGGKRKGIGLGWSREGLLTDSAAFDGAGNGTSVSWWDSGKLRSAGRYMQDTLMTGPWTFYHPNGNLTARETYDRGKRVTQQYYTEDGTPIADTSNTDREAIFSTNPTAWRRYLERNLNVQVPVKNGAHDGRFTVAVRFIVNTDGTLDKLEPLTRHGFGMEEEVVRILSKSSNWVPARQHNRLVKAYRIQPVTFAIVGK